MKKYVIEASIIFLFIIIGVGIVSDINGTSLKSEEVGEMEDKIENNEEIDDGNLSEVMIESEDTSNFISSIAASIANLVVETLNFGLKIIVKIMNGITN